MNYYYVIYVILIMVYKIYKILSVHKYKDYLGFTQGKNDTDHEHELISEIYINNNRELSIFNHIQNTYILPLSTY